MAWPSLALPGPPWPSPLCPLIGFWQLDPTGLGLHRNIQGSRLGYTACVTGQQAWIYSLCYRAAGLDIEPVVHGSRLGFTACVTLSWHPLKVSMLQIGTFGAQNQKQKAISYIC